MAIKTPPLIDRVFHLEGVVNAIFDGACLVNLIHDLPSGPTMQELGDLFHTYFKKRYPVARIAIEGSSQFSRLFNDQAQVENDGRVVMFNNVPRWLQRWTLDKTNRIDPKLEFTLENASRSPLLRSCSLEESLLIDQLPLQEVEDDIGCAVDLRNVQDDQIV
ncbi:hypothetical protein BGZ76_005607 [Entomortierella beljakovae]|nr:hypothetical protein BGZ76_005607 [Entomortierella beljakovae]